MKWFLQLMVSSALASRATLCSGGPYQGPDRSRRCDPTSSLGTVWLSVSTAQVTVGLSRSLVNLSGRSSASSASMSTGLYQTSTSQAFKHPASRLTMLLRSWSPRHYHPSLSLDKASMSTYRPLVFAESLRGGTLILTRLRG